MTIEIESNNIPSNSPSTKNQLIENIIEIARKDEALKAYTPEIERIVEELFFHISKFSDDDLTFGKITPLNEGDINSGDYNLSIEEIKFFNNLIRILKRLFRSSRGTL
ncbi:MAG: hypothetical protein ACKO6C_01930 [Alphaproteobacteria bacterium]